jgi:hypothetical protein
MAANGVSRSPGRLGGGPGRPVADGKDSKEERAARQWWPSSRRPSRQRLALSLVLFGYAWLAASTRPFTFMSLLVVLLPGAVVAGVAIWGPPDRIEAPDRLDIAGFSWWLVIVAVLFEWEAAGFRDNSPWWHPSLTELVDPIIAPYPLRSIAFFLWLITGWALVRR